MVKHLKGQPLSSTRMDAHGEKLSLEQLSDLASKLPSRTPLHQMHDYSKPVCGELSNFRIIQDELDPMHSVLVCDVTYEEALMDFTPGGLSWSFTVPMKSNTSNPEMEIFLPFPHYKDESLVDSLLDSDFPIRIGQWRKKASDPLTVALVMLPTTLLSTTIYKGYLEPKIKSGLASLFNKWPKGLSINVQVEIPIDVYQPNPTGIFIPSKEEGINGLATLTEGIKLASEFCLADYVHSGRKISRIRLIYDAVQGKYSVLAIEYRDEPSIQVQ